MVRLRTWFDKITSEQVIQGTLALGMGGVVGYLAIVQQPIPDVVAGLAGAAFGFFFGMTRSGRE